MATVLTLATMLVAARLGFRPRWGALLAMVVALGAVQLLARGMTAPLREMAEAAGAMARGDHSVDGDPDRMRQVVDNLVLNAHRHAPGAAVAARARAGPPGTVRLKIEDDGPGLPVPDLARVFDRFTRADASRSVEGSGLGLAIVRSIVELHGGAVHAEPASPRGLRLVIDLPAAA